jgi:hypothetical protein
MDVSLRCFTAWTVSFVWLDATVTWLNVAGQRLYEHGYILSSMVGYGASTRGSHVAYLGTCRWYIHAVPTAAGSVSSRTGTRIGRIQWTEGSLRHRKVTARLRKDHRTANGASVTLLRRLECLCVS